MVFMKFPVLIEPDKEAGGHVVWCPTLKGCVSQGETKEEALENIKDAITTYLAGIRDSQKLSKAEIVEVSV